MSDLNLLVTSMDNAARVLTLCLTLSVRKDIFGQFKPDEQQLAWAFGFCDGFAQSVGLNEDEDFIIFISITFEKTFGAKGIAFFRKTVKKQKEMSELITAGGNAHHAWITNGSPPLMPMRR